MCWHKNVIKYLNDFFLLYNITVNIITTAMIARITNSINPTTNHLVLTDSRLIVGLIGIVLVVITTVLLQNIKQDTKITTLPDTEVSLSIILLTIVVLGVIEIECSCVDDDNNTEVIVSL